MIQNQFWKNSFYPTRGPGDVIARDHQNYKNVPLFFFSLFPHKKHFYEQNMLVTRHLERDYI